MPVFPRHGSLACRQLGAVVARHGAATPGFHPLAVHKTRAGSVPGQRLG